MKQPTVLGKSAETQTNKEKVILYLILVSKIAKAYFKLFLSITNTFCDSSKDYYIFCKE